MKLNKNDLAKKFREFSGIRFEDSLSLTNLFLGSLRSILVNMKAGDVLEIRGLGVFRMTKARPKPSACVPGTDKKVSIPSKRKLSFKASTTIKRELLEVK